MAARHTNNKSEFVSLPKKAGDLEVLPINEKKDSLIC
jgi:hypothetical protein